MSPILSTRHFEVNKSGIPLHFLHGNGYPPNCYKPFFEHLKSGYQVFGMFMRPLWDEARPEYLTDWNPLLDDLLRFLAPPQPVPVIGVGHSMGATITLRAALREPEKFRALVLIDPVLYIPTIQFMSKLLRAIGLPDRVQPLISGALTRRRTFDDLERLFRGYRTRKIFRYMTDAGLRAYIEGITQPKVGGGYELVFSPEWEAQLYRTSLQKFDVWRDLPKLEVPTLFIRGAETNTFLENSARLVKRKQPKIRVESLNQTTHLLPLERPKEVFEVAQTFLKGIL